MRVATEPVRCPPDASGASGAPVGGGRGPGMATVSWGFLGSGLVAVLGLLLLDDPVRGWLFVAIVVATTVAAAVALRARPDARGPLHPLLVGLLLVAPAYALWYPGRLAWGLDVGDPSIVDVLFLVGYVAFIVVSGTWSASRAARTHGSRCSTA